MTGVSAAFTAWYSYFLLNSNNSSFTSCFIFKISLCATNAAGSRLSPGASGEFGSHAIRPHSSHHMQVMTIFKSAAFAKT
jgi:hypothetical protein